MKPTIDNIDLNKPNTLNLTSVENEYDKAMLAERDSAAWTFFLARAITDRNARNADKEWNSLDESEKAEALAQMSEADKAWMMDKVL